MKKYILPLVFILAAILSLQSCKKDQNETKYVNLNENIQSGSTYSLNLDTYAGRSATASIATQATSFGVSQLDKDVSTGCSVYHFSADSKTKEKQTVVLNLVDKKNSPCGHHDENKTVITINFTVQ